MCLDEYILWWKAVLLAEKTSPGYCQRWSARVEFFGDWCDDIKAKVEECLWFETHSDVNEVAGL